MIQPTKHIVQNNGLLWSFVRNTDTFRSPSPLFVLPKDLLKARDLDASISDDVETLEESRLFKSVRSGGILFCLLVLLRFSVLLSGFARFCYGCGFSASLGHHVLAWFLHGFAMVLRCFNCLLGFTIILPGF